MDRLQDGQTLRSIFSHRQQASVSCLPSNQVCVQLVCKEEDKQEAHQLEEKEMSFSDKLSHNSRLSSGIIEAAAALGVDPVDLATIISYETAGTLDPQQVSRGPATKHGVHKGFIQFGDKQRVANGVDLSTYDTAMDSQLGANGAIVNYFRRNGLKKGMGILDMYSIVNTGGPGNYNWKDEKAGGAPGTVADKVNNQMDGHRDKAIKLLGNDKTPLIPLGNPHYNNGFGSAVLTAQASDNTSNSTVLVSDEANDEPDSPNADVSTSMNEESSDKTDDNEARSYSAYMMQNNPYQDSRRVLVNAPSVQTQSFTEERKVSPFRSIGQRFTLPYEL